MRSPARRLLRLWLYGVAAASAAFLAFPAEARSLNQPSSTASELRLPAALVHGSGAVSDFDGDRRADFVVATPHSRRGGHFYQLDVRLSGHPDAVVELESQVPGGLHVATLDIDGDHDLDLVITTRFGRQPVGVWINNGEGAFSQGDSAAYPSSIWQENRRFFETPETPSGQAGAFDCPTDGWPTEAGDETFSDPCVPLRLRPITERQAESCVNPSSLLRAPPLL